MKGGRDEEKMIGPLFPRLHVNDTEKGGPRAPPRNKMALYEQLSVPSQRFSSGSATMLPLPHNIGSSLVPSMSSSHGGGQERSIFTPFCKPPAPAHLAEKLHSYSFGGVKLTTSMPNHERKSIMPTNFQALNDTGHLSSTAKCNLFQPYNFSNSVNSSMKKHGGGDDFRVPTFPQSEVTPHFSNSLQSMDGDKLPPLSPNSSIQLQTTCKKQTKRNNTTDLKSRQHVGNQSEGNPKVSHSVKDPTHWPTSIPSTGDKILADAFLCPSNGDKNPKSFKRAHPSSNQENRNSLVDDISRLHGTNTQSHRECVALRENTPLRDGALVEQKKGIGMGNASMVRGESYSNQSLGHNHRSASRLENGSEYPEGKECGSLQEGDVNRNDGVLDTSMVDSILGLAPDVVVGVIGEKQFWKARRAIVNQQRVFGVQVFELHRLIKVQRLIARSPHILLEDNLYLGKSSIKGSNVKKLPSECVLEAPPLIVKPKDDSQKRNLSTKYAAENITGKLPFSSADNVTNKVPITPRSNYGPYPGKPPPASMATETKLAPWCYQAPPGNQWLVPVMSPSEGLVYKPYSGPCPPAGGFMAPVYGSYGPVSLTPGSGDFLNTTYGVPASHQQGIGILPGTLPLGRTYFPPHGMPVMNPAISDSAIEQMSPFAGAPSNGQDNQSSMEGINFTIPYQSSCNMPSQKSGVISCAGKFQASKDSELQGSTASSPSERVQGDALSLFPMTPTVQVSNQPTHAHSSEQQTQVIKVVPHNPISATESAARIFQFIQEERKQCD